MKRPLKENEIRYLLSKALSRQRRRAHSPSVRNALHLNLNRELDEDARGDSLKYFAAVIVVGALLYTVCSRIGLG